MKERPILFSDPMVRAIIERRKTMTRRIVKPQPTLGRSQTGPQWVHETKYCTTILNDTSGPWSLLANECPHGQPGDRLWVRETFRIVDFDLKNGDWDGRVEYRADNTMSLQRFHLPNGEDTRTGWRPSIHMPRWASRITLEIESVRVERLQELTEVDAISEGVESIRALPSMRGQARGRSYRDYDMGIGFHQARQSFRSLWNAVHGPESWALNPWVWVIRFNLVEAK